ncbi:MAG: aminotransferase class V-fold PLP-dependent enzyme [Cyclobacteriaceae bacterium]
MSHNIYFTPGPSQLFYTFQEHFKKAIQDDIPSISHRSREFIKIVAHTKHCLKELLEIPDGYDIYFINSANEAWDRIIQNLVLNSSHHFVNGAFSNKFYEFALMYGMPSTVHQVQDGTGFTDFSIPEEAELIGITKNETSVGYTFAEDEIAQIRENYPSKIIALDIVSATPSVPIDLNNVDTAYFSVQKAFGLPPGLGVWICNDKCLEKASLKSEKVSIGSYRSLQNLKKFSDKDQTPETPNSLFIYLLGKIAGDMLSAGKKRIINDTKYKSAILYQAIEEHPSLTPFVEDARYRSKTTIVAKGKNTSGIIKAFKSKGMILGDGYGSYKEEHLRIANFPVHSKESMEMLCDTLRKIE